MSRISVARFVVLFFVFGVGVVVGSFAADRFDFHVFQGSDNKGFSAVVEPSEQGAVASVVVSPVAQVVRVARRVDAVVRATVALRVHSSASVVRVTAPVIGRAAVALTRVVHAVVV
ncbi:MAG: hypothetical protein HOP12_09705 [Candidatus Eisenbacteria bacterium]|uniref:Uncharacterized protein n=1 Tax=Eiseniibacteriota bacterium TaxID=2212470 RepID=A0A849SJ19_UNCEI|nr:hypothetical protein [Candidatus Eisenbacteria bacterium]